MTKYKRTRRTGLIDPLSLHSVYNGYDSLILSDSPVGFWPMQEAGGNVIDISGNNHTGTKVGAGNINYQASGPAGDINSIEFPGITATGFSVANNVAWSSGSFTIEGWVYLDSLAVYPFWLAKQRTSSFHEHSAAIHYTSGYQAVVTQSSDVAWMSALSSSTPLFETWLHQVVVMDATIPSLTVYVNGVVVAQDTTTSGSRSSAGTGVLGLGYRPGLNGDNYAMKGRLTMLAFYDYTLTPTQIANHHSAMQ